MNREEIQLDYTKSFSNRGNHHRLKELFKRAQKGEAITLGFLGGSITQGCLSSTPELCYAYRVYEWWCKTFPKAHFTYINAGIGATDSQFGCARVEEDLLVHRPDFVIVEYSVNDEPNEHFCETYEGLVRKIWLSETKPAVLLVHNVFYHNGGNTQLYHGRVARYYDLPAVSMQSTIYPKLLNGSLENRMITQDDLHPNDLGHELVASVITYGLGTILAEVEIPETEPQFPEAPMTANGYEKSMRYRNQNSTPVTSGFTADTEKQNGITDIFKNGWTATKEGDSIVFEVEGSSIGIQYRKTMQLPAPVAAAFIDQDETNPILLDANFNETWGDKLVLDTLLDHGENTKHTLEIRLVETHPQDQLPFYLVSVITSK